MTEGPTPRDPRNDPTREPLGGPEAPVDQPPPDYRPADTTPGPQEAPRWESPGDPPPAPPQGGGWDPGPSSTPPPPPPPAGDQGWGQQPGEYGQQPGGQYQGGQYPAAGSGMAENVASGLSYVLTWLTGLIFFLVDKRPEVRFHAMQSIAYGRLWTLIAVVRPYMPGPPRRRVTAGGRRALPTGAGRRTGPRSPATASPRRPRRPAATSPTRPAT